MQLTGSRRDSPQQEVIGDFSSPPQGAIVSRRTLLRTAWSAPVITVAVAAPTAAASVSDPLLVLDAVRHEIGGAWVTVMLSGVPEVRQYVYLEGSVTNGWKQIRLFVTDDRGYCRTRVNRTEIETYSLIRASVTIGDWGLITSNMISPKLWT